LFVFFLAGLSYQLSDGFKVEKTHIAYACLKND
jgi:hypothetical protein